MFDLFGFSLLLLPFAFFWCCCLSCGECDSRKFSILVTFQNTGTWANWVGCGCFEGAPNSCANYKGTTYEVPIFSYSPYVGFGSTSAICTYRVAGECDNHYIVVTIFTGYANGDYFSTTVRVQIMRTTPSGCNPTTGELIVTAVAEDPFDCDAPRSVNIASPTPGPFVSSMCTVTGGVALVESP